MEIYIAPLQRYYSEVLPTLAWLKRRVLRKLHVDVHVGGRGHVDRERGVTYT